MPSRNLIIAHCGVGWRISWAMSLCSPEGQSSSLCSLGCCLGVQYLSPTQAASSLACVCLLLPVHKTVRGTDP